VHNTTQIHNSLKFAAAKVLQKNELCKYLTVFFLFSRKKE